MKFIIIVLAVLVSIGSAVAVDAEVTNVSTQQRTKVVGNNVTTSDSKTTIVNNVKTSKPRSNISGLKPKTK